MGRVRGHVWTRRDKDEHRKTLGKSTKRNTTDFPHPFCQREQQL